MTLDDMDQLHCVALVLREPVTNLETAQRRMQECADRIEQLTGPATKPPIMTLKNSHCPWSVEVDGDDLVVRNIKATCFGGAFDAGDNGETESGVMNDGRDPNLMGVALPIRSTEAATRQSPLAFKGPHIPWGTTVLVYREEDRGDGTAVECKLIDNGPNVLEFPTHALDVNPNVAAKFNPDNIPANKLANEWSGEGFSYRIIGGAKFIS